MPAATVTVTINSISQSFNFGNMYGAILTGTIGASPLTYTTGGIACSFALPLVKAQLAPQLVLITSLNGWIYEYVPGTNVANGTLKIFTALGTELTNGNAIPAGNSGDTLTFLAIWLANL
jgi:hypothetical protein